MVIAIGSHLTQDSCGYRSSNYHWAKKNKYWLCEDGWGCNQYILSRVFHYLCSGFSKFCQWLCGWSTADTEIQSQIQTKIQHFGIFDTLRKKDNDEGGYHMCTAPVRNVDCANRYSWTKSVLLSYGFHCTRSPFVWQNPCELHKLLSVLK